MKKFLKSDKLARFGSQVGRYQVAMRWLWLEVYANYRKLSLVACVLMFLALGLKLGALLLLSKYVHLLDLGQSIKLLGWVVDNPRQSYPLLVAAAGSSLVLFLASCVAHYWSEISMLRLSVLYEERCVKRAIAIISMVGNHPRLSEWKDSYTRLVTSDARYCGTIARLALRSFLPLASGIVTLGILIYIDMNLTVSLAILVLMAMPWLYKVSVRGSAHTRMLEHFTTKGNVEKRRLVVESSAQAVPGALDSRVASFNFESTSIGTSLNAYLGRLKATVESTFVTSIIMAFAIFVILLQKGSELLYGATGWGQLAAYLVVLRICLGNLTQLMGLLTSLNRFYMHLYRFMTFSVAGVRLCKAGEFAPATADVWRRSGAKGASAIQEEDILDDI